MSNQEVIDLSSDEEIDVADLIDVKPVLLSNIAQDNSRSNLVNEVPRSFCVTSQASLHADGFSLGSGLPDPSMRICRQFWKSGDYEAGKTLGPVSRSGPSRLRIHPKFLHSNATSHKWAFGAIAELLDNAVDEVHKGATLVIVDKFVNPRNGDPALLIQDDGSGMDPESMRRCMSFGFSDKQSDSSIGQYGNGFKTSTMRLGADVIVFSRCMNKRVSTQSVGLLSYTFLRQTGCDDIVVPVVDYEFNSLTGAFGRIIRHDEKHFFTNLSTLLKWSLFSTEVELLNQFNDIGHHGTKIIVFNLWLNEDGGMELDFDSDPEDILISGAQRNVEKKTIEHNLSKKYVANLLHYSLRAYSSVLYLRVPENFKIVLRGQVVKHHPIAKDLMYRECIKYKPQVGGIIEGEVVTTIGYLMGAPSINVHGFNVYHRNRLILPFWRVAHNSYGKGRGVVGVLEANFIKPTHDKQDFEKSTLFQKLESRLKEMTYEYWDFHCHLVGYTKSRNPEAINPPAANQTPNLRTTNGVTTVAEASQGHLLGYTKSKNPAAINPAPANRTPNLRTSNGSTTVAEASQALLRSSSISGQHTNGIVNSQTGLAYKRKYERDDTGAMEPLRKQVVDAGVGSSNKETRSKCNTGQNGKQAVITMMQENKKLLDKCLEYEETEKKLLDKVGKLRRELLEVQQVHKNLLEELKLMDSVKAEKP